ncbi:MAG: TIR domain-containing protein [Rhodoblastus sp.]
MSRIFLSHSSKDSLKAVEVRDWLATNGWRDVFLDLDPAAGIAPGEHWQNELRAAADRCEAVIFIVSSHWLASPWCLSEFLLAKQLGKRLFPLLLGVRIEDLPSEIASDHQAVDLVRDPECWIRLKEGLRRAGLDATSFPFEKGRRAYPGFEPLTEDDAAIFFGREAQVLRGLDRLRLMRDAGAERMMVVLGASGAGKSSFVRAGLWPRLFRDDRNFWPLPVVRPERAVLTGRSGLYAALEAAIADARAAQSPDIARLPKSRAGLAAAFAKGLTVAELLAALRKAGAARATAGPSMVLVIDQAEELLNEEGRAEAQEFLALLAAALAAEKSLLVVLAIRSDAYPRLQAEPLIAAVGREPFDLPPMPEGSLRLIIEGPAHFANPPLEIEPALVEALMADSTGQDALPLLAFTLHRLARDYGAEGKIELAHYQASDGVRGAIGVAVREALDDGRRRRILPAEQSELDGLLRSAFVPHLARVNEAGEFARRVAYAAELPTASRPLVDLLVEARLLTRDKDDKGEIVEVTHEALLREWPLLRSFLELDREFLVGKRQLAEDMAIWEQAPAASKDDALLTGHRLVRAQHWALERAAQDLSEPERSFIAESLRVAGAKRRWRNLIGATAVAALAIFSALALYNWIDARQAATAAALNEQRARTAQEAAEANAKTAAANESKARSAQFHAQRQDSRSLAEESLRATQQGDSMTAMRSALAALPGNSLAPDRPYVAHAEYALAKAWSATRLEQVITGSNDRVNHASFDPSGTHVAIATRDGFLKTYDLMAAKEAHSSYENRSAVYKAVFSRDGKKLVSTHQDPPSVMVRDAGNGAILLDQRVSTPPGNVGISEDASSIVIASYNGDTRPYVLDVAKGSKPRPLEFPNADRSGAKDLEVSADGRLALLVGYSGFWVWRLSDGQLLAYSQDKKPDKPEKQFVDLTKYESEESIDLVTLLVDGGRIAIVGKKTVYIVDAATGRVDLSWKFADEWVVGNKFALMLPDNRLALTRDATTVVVYSLATGAQTATRTFPSKIISATKGDDGTLAFLTEDNIVNVWSANIETRFTAPPGARLIEMSAAGDKLIAYGGKEIWLWNVNEDGLRLSIADKWRAVAIDDRAAHAILIGAQDESKTALWSAASGLVEAPALGDLAIDRWSAVSFSPSGRWLAARRAFSATEDADTLQNTGRILKRLVKQTGRNEEISVKPKVALDAIALVDTERGSITHVMIDERPASKRSRKLAFVTDDGLIVALIADDYVDDGKEKRTFAEIWRSGALYPALSLEQDGGDGVLTLSADQTTLALSTKMKGGRGGRTSLWTLSTGALVARFEKEANAADNGRAAAQRGDRLLLGGAPELVDLSTGRSVGQIASAARGVRKVVISEDQTRLLVDHEGTTSSTLWDLDRAKQIPLVAGVTPAWAYSSFTSDGRRVLTRSRRNDKSQDLTIYDSGTGGLVRNIHFPGELLDYYGGATGRMVVAQTGARSIEIHDGDGAAEPRRMSLQATLRRWRFTGSDTRLVTADEAGHLQIWDCATGVLLKEISGIDPVDPLGSASEEGFGLPVLLADGAGVVLDTATGATIWRSPDDLRPTSMGLAPGGASVLVQDSRTVRLFSVADGALIAAAPLQAGDTVFSAFNPDGDRLLVYVRSATRFARLFDIPARKEIAKYDDVVMEAESRGGKIFAIAAGKSVKIYDFRSGELAREIPFDEVVRKIEVSAGGGALAVATNDSKLHVVDLSSSKLVTVAALRQIPRWLHFAARDSRLLVYEESGNLSLFDAHSPVVVSSFEVDWSLAQGEWQSSFSPDGTLLATRSPDNYIRIFRTSDGVRVTEFNWDDNIFAGMAFSADSRRLVLVTRKGRVLQWDVATNKAAGTIQLDREYSNYRKVIRATSDPTQMVVVDDKGTVDLFSLNSTDVRTFRATEPDSSKRAVLSPDGALLATLGGNSKLGLWHVATRQLLLEVRPPDMSVYSDTILSFAPDGRSIALTNVNAAGAYLLRAPKIGDELTAAAKALLTHFGSPAQSTVQPRAWKLGIYMIDAPPDAGSDAPAGARITEVASDSPAQAAGLRVGDIIVGIDGQPVKNSAEAAAIVKQAGAMLRVAFRRGEKQASVQAILGD